MVKRVKSLGSGEHKQIARRLALARDRANLSQGVVARVLQESQTWVSKIETGRRRVDAVELRRLCLLYKTDANTIIMPERTGSARARRRPSASGQPQALPAGPTGASDTSREGDGEDVELPRKVADREPPERGGKPHQPRYSVPRRRNRAARTAPAQKPGRRTR